MLSKLIVVFFNIFLVCISIDPTGQIFHVKELLFIFLLALAFLNRQKIKSIPKGVLITIFFCLFFPIWGICVALLKGKFDDLEYGFGHLKSFLFILFFFVLAEIDFKSILKALCLTGCIMAGITTLIFIIAQFNEELFRIVYGSSIENSNIIISNREYYGFIILGIYFKAAPLILFSYTYLLFFVKQRYNINIFLILMNLFSLLIAGSRTPTLIVIAITLLYIYNRLKIRYIIKLFIAFFVAIAMAGIIFILASEKEGSNEVKAKNFSSYVESTFEGANSIVGAGLGSTFWAEGRETYISASEFSYFDILRIYGLFIGSFLIFLVFYPTLYYLKNRANASSLDWFAITYFLYMVLAGTNPLLISSTGMLTMSVGLAFVYHLHNKQIFL